MTSAIAWGVNAQLLRQLDAQNFPEVRNTLERADVLRDEFNQKLDTIRADMLAQVYASASTVMRDQQRAILISAIVTAIAAILGLVFAMLVSNGITRPVHRLLEGTREVEAGRLEKSIDVTTRDEIGQLSVAFNRMIERLRHNEGSERPSADTWTHESPRDYLINRHWLPPKANAA
jgi:adenylate cyclase